MFRVVVAGSRTFTNYPFLAWKLDHLLCRRSDAFILTGDAKGADELAVRYAEERGLPYQVYPADWSQGKQAGPARNATMASEADGLVAFWVDQSTGTGDMVRKACGYGLSVRVVRVR